MLRSSIFSYSRRFLSAFSDAQWGERKALLKEIYTPSFSKLKERSKEWYELGASGKVWENYFHPFEWRAQDYDYQAKDDCFLPIIDSLKYDNKLSSSDLMRRMSVSFSHQSCAMEGNSLGIGDSEKIWNKMNEDYNLDDLLEPEEIQLPDARSLSNKSEDEVIEIRNHLLATYYLNNKLLDLEQEVSIDEIKRIHYILLKDTPCEKINVWGGIQEAGKFRTVSMQARGYHLTVYPYGLEVPALMKRFLRFRDDSIKNGNIHPILIACRLLETFNHIHPFYDGNGRVGRSIMALYLIRNGYPPVVFQELDRKEYVDSMVEARATKNYNRLYDIVVQTIFDTLISNK